MYDMGNQALRSLVTGNFDDETWTKIYNKANAPESFLDVEQYDDAVTSDLASESSEVLDMKTSTVLRTLVNDWVAHVATARYTDLLDRTGTHFYHSPMPSQRMMGYDQQTQDAS